MAGLSESSEGFGSLRRAVLADAVALLAISNDTEVRRQSFRMDPIPLASHQEWLRAHLEDAARPFFVLEVRGRVAGQVRFDVQDDALRLSYSLAAEFRGHGLAVPLVRGGCAAARKDVGHVAIVASTKTENLVSQRVLERVGFERVRTFATSVEYLLAPSRAHPLPEAED